MTRNDSSTSASGGPGGSAGGILPRIDSLIASFSLDTFLEETLLLLWLG